MANSVGTNHSTRASTNWSNQILRRSHGRLDRFYLAGGRPTESSSRFLDPSRRVGENWAVSAMASEALIRVAGLRKTFGKHRVLDGLDLDVRAGEAVAVPGAHGDGKTTMLNGLATLRRATRGHASVAGHGCPNDAQHVRPEIRL